MHLIYKYTIYPTYPISLHLRHTLTVLAVIVVLINICFVGSVAAKDDYRDARMEMVKAIRKTVSYSSNDIGKKNLKKEVMTVMSEVARHEFVPESLRPMAYLNRPLPIGNRQTISQPYIVALMTDLADIDKNSVVLEVGTGSGYQAAVLAEIARHVYTIEIIRTLGERAEKNLDRLGYKNITVRIGDGYHGWQEHAPFDAILVTAAPERIPQPLLEQLKPGGKMVIPVGSQHRAQQLQVIEKNSTGQIMKHSVISVMFVPLTGVH